MSEPFVHAFVLAQAITRCPQTGMFSILGRFNSFNCSTLPHAAPPLACYALVSDVDGEFTSRFDLLDPDLNVVSSVTTGVMRGRRSEENELGVTFAAIPLSRVGRWSMQFSINGKILATSRLDVRQTQTQIFDDYTG